MKKINFNEYISNNTLYFAKYGRGAVIVALDSNDLFNTAEKYHSFNDSDVIFGQKILFPIQEISYSEDCYSITFKFENNTIINRTLPESQVTIDLFKS